ncbi:hypothetical protein CP982_07850 [Streptomyces spectabilis]|uniref:Uncharacterized protein n=1 Tax=Streptomyces spectabilis TaxID=68270 RepID=A0A5P2X682_STRST|nr:hypothetical protein CP982_07850 [Streptomyces spectabilis]
MQETLAANPGLVREAWSLGALAPPSAASTGSSQKPRGHGSGRDRLLCPPTGAPVCGRFWVTWPDGSGCLTKPAQLASVLRASGGPGLLAEALG